MLFFVFFCMLAGFLTLSCLFPIRERARLGTTGRMIIGWLCMQPPRPSAVSVCPSPSASLPSLSFSASRLFYGLPFALPFALCPTDKWTAPVRLSRSQRRALGCRLRYGGGIEEREDGKSTTRTTSTECTTESRAGSRGSSNKGASSVDKWTAQVAGRRHEQQQQHQAEPGN